MAFIKTFKKIQPYLLNPTKISSIFITVFFMGVATAICLLFFHIAPETKYIAHFVLIYILALLLIARFTCGYIYGIVGSLFSVISANYLFTYPILKLNFTLTGYPLLFLQILAISIIASTMTSLLNKQAQIISEREKMLLEAEKEKMRANLLRAISHDLRTPLTGIIGNSSTYLENLDYLSDAEKKDIILNIYMDSNWLLNMVENLLSVTRIHGDSKKVVTSLESVEEVVSEAVIRLKKRTPSAVIIARVPDELIMAPMDAILIEQVIINLLENAIFHAESKQPIEINVIKSGKTVDFYVKDYGIGIPEHRLSTIFDGNVYQQTSSTDSHKGMGIGLSICKTIIIAHHGEIYACNHPEGAEFIFKLPKEVCK